MSWIKQLFSRHRVYDELSEEIRAHLDEKIEELVATGMPRKEAAASARCELGNLTLLEEESRAVWRRPSAEDFFMDIRYGLRTLARNPGFTAVAVLTLALGIGANTAIFSLMNAVLLRNLPVKNPSQLVLFGAGKWGGIMDEVPSRSWQLFSFPFYRDVQADKSVFTDVTALASMPNEVHGTIGESSESEAIQARLVSGTYFSTLGVHPILGRTFTEDDDRILINETMARRFFPNMSPLGRTFRFGGPDAKLENDRTVIGVVKDAKYMALKERRWPAAYLPYSQEVGYLWDFEVRYSGDAGSIVAAIREAIRQVDPRIPVTGVGTLAEEVDRSVVDQRLTAQLSSVFSIVAVFLACMGIYGLMSYSVVHQRNEIGIRMALGAQQGQVLRLILRQGFLLAAAGVAVGVALAFMLTRFLGSLLFDVRPVDPVTFVCVACLLMLVSLSACYLPARRAMRVDPVVALRYE
jgi:hypothetical protein